MDEIRGRVWDFGWRTGLFSEIDGAIESQGYYTRINSKGGNIERYGKKYGMSAYFEAAARREDRGKLGIDSFDEFRLSDVDIDPSFPDVIEQLDMDGLHWIDDSGSDSDWLERGVIDLPAPLLIAEAPNDIDGTWILVSGHLGAEDANRRRTAWGFITGLLVDKDKSEQLVTILKERTYPGNDFVPRTPEDHYMFAGEAPWRAFFGVTTDEYYLGRGLYGGIIEDQNQKSISVEILSHEYGWESYHSSLNQSGGAIIPSADFSRGVGLRPHARSFDQVDATGAKASLSLKAPSGFKNGNLLYLRKDLIQQYASDNAKELVVFAWGERQYMDEDYQLPDWAMSIYRDHDNVWKYVTTLTELTEPTT